MHGDLGPSFQYEGYRVTELVAAGLPVSLALGAAALALALLLGGAIGVVTGRRPGSALDHVLSNVALLGVSIPNYVIAPLLILLFAMGLGWRSEERRVGKEGVSTCRSRWSPYL